MRPISSKSVKRAKSNESIEVSLSSIRNPKIKIKGRKEEVILFKRYKNNESQLLEEADDGKLGYFMKKDAI